MKLFIVEDEAILQQKYFEYLSPYFKRVDLTSDYSEALQALDRSDDHDVYLIDYNLPDGNGLEIVRRIFKDHRHATIVLITAYSKERVAIESLNLGVFRYLEKPVDKERLVKTIKEAITVSKQKKDYKNLEEKFLISADSGKKLTDQYFLTERELEVLQNILIFGKNRLVAAELGISAGTVRNHLSNIFQKLHLNNKDELKQFIMNFNKNC